MTATDWLKRDRDKSLSKYHQADHTVENISRQYQALVTDVETPRWWERVRGITGPRPVTIQDAIILARQDPRRKDAVGDRVHYAAEATMYSTSGSLDVLLQILAAIEKLTRIVDEG